MKGIYAVFFEMEDKTIEIGALGDKKFEAGTYVYIGSAMNGVENRLKRHYSQEKKKHWHIDYFSQEASPVYSIVFPLGSEYECILARTVSEENEAVADFGASDCSCDSHLYRIGEKGLLSE